MTIIQKWAKSADIRGMALPFTSLIGIKAAVSIGAAIVLVPLILNMGLGYIDTIERIGDGEEVSSTNMLDAAKNGIKPGATSEEAEKVLGHNTTAVASDRAGENCKRYALGDTGKGMVVCYSTQGTGANQHWLVTRSYLG